ncbi:hypothetical protein [Ectobacillus ponti]|uniref:PrgI-like domain-containing protein n=1 Tax=Ectobacillus ponti TaxID=2961894 RepID=A0AA41X9V1_9BACI|nr:hypothetical protein [Ectobacillus ponti]MCP8968948.1 hypothetical protein [Ectobacillus ponti]
MREKEEYTIPDNVRGHFEVAPNVSLKDLLYFVPGLLIVIPVLLMPVSMYVKIPAATICLAVSGVLVYLRPVRENIPFWQHVRELLRFAVRQRMYTYRKEEWGDVEQLESETGRAEAAAAREGGAGSHSRTRA